MATPILSARRKLCVGRGEDEGRGGRTGSTRARVQAPSSREERVVSSCRETRDICTGGLNRNGQTDQCIHLSLPTRSRPTTTIQKNASQPTHPANIAQVDVDAKHPITKLSRTSAAERHGQSHGAECANCGNAKMARHEVDEGSSSSAIEP